MGKKLDDEPLKFLRIEPGAADELAVVVFEGDKDDDGFRNYCKEETDRATAAKIETYCAGLAAKGQPFYRRDLNEMLHMKSN
jgi:hypothetical protein